MVPQISTQVGRVSKWIFSGFISPPIVKNSNDSVTIRGGAWPDGSTFLNSHRLPNGGAAVVLHPIMIQGTVIA